MAEEGKGALHIKPAGAVPQSDSMQRRRRPRAELSPTRLIQGIREGDRRLLAEAITLLESSRPEDRNLAEQVLENCRPANGNSIRVGITGAPGVGKSTLIEAIGRYLVSECREQVAVLAFDPSSPLSGGSILGDKIRMPQLSSSEMAFVRPSPARGVHGGVGRYTREAILLCEAAGYRNILVETVGVGQSETAVRELVDFLLLATIPGAGDELQGIKRGVMEVVDLVAINKADGVNRRAAEQACAEAESALQLLPSSASGWKPRAVACSAKTGDGIVHLWSSVVEYTRLTRRNGWFNQVRLEQARRSIREVLEQELSEIFRVDPVLQDRMSMLEQEVLSGQITALSAVRQLMLSLARRIDAGKLV